MNVMNITRRFAPLVAIATIACGGFTHIATNPATNAPCSKQEWFPLGGSASMAAPLKTPSGFTLLTNGLGQPSRKVLRTGRSYLEENGASSLALAYEVGASRQDLVKEVEEAWAQVSTAWIKCGGRYAAAVGAMHPQDFTIEVVDRPMCAPNGMWAGGMAFKQQKLIRCCIVCIDSLRSGSPSLRWFRDYVRWELGNQLQFTLGEVPRTIAEERGDKPPC